MKGIAFFLGVPCFESQTTNLTISSLRSLCLQTKIIQTARMEKILLRWTLVQSVKISCFFGGNFFDINSPRKINMEPNLCENDDGFGVQMIFPNFQGWKSQVPRGVHRLGWLKPLFHRLGSTHPASSRRRNSPTWREDDDERNSNHQLDVMTKKSL